MKIEYPSEDEMRRQREQILDASLPERPPLHVKLKKIYWEPGLRVVFYQCGPAWLLTGTVYLFVSAACLLSREHAKRQLFFSLLCCPFLYLTFSFAALHWEEQTATTELKQTLRHSLTRLVSLRMFYSSIALVFSDLLLLWMLQCLPSLRGCSARELWTAGSAGISAMFLFALLSLYLYHRLGNCRYLGILLPVWLLTCAGILLSDERLAVFLFRNIPLPVHLGAAVCSLLAFTGFYSKKLNQKAVNLCLH